MLSTQEYARYLLAKKTVDDRALNRVVVDAVRSGMQEIAQRPRILEIGAGVGTMVARMIDWQIVQSADYVMLDADQGKLARAREWLAAWAAARGLRVELAEDGLQFTDGRGVDVNLRALPSELGAFLEGRPSDRFDLIVANAVLDLVDTSRVLPRLLELLTPRGLYWFSVNFDGETIFQPEDTRDELLLSAYHRGMDERPRAGMCGGDSRTGRRLFDVLRASGAQILEAGSSDWVVFAGAGGYRHDESFFLNCILRMIQAELSSRPDLDPEALRCWLQLRDAQLARGELVYIAHQLDVAGRAPGA
jgi:SAM-dependent methyltransferase